MHKDSTAGCLPESIVWIQGKLRFDWHFAIPSASVSFRLDRAAPCLCVLQAANVWHGTYHTPATPAHDAIGVAAVSRNVVSNEAARETFGGPTRK